jgi:hypothetical protein
MKNSTQTAIDFDKLLPELEKRTKGRIGSSRCDRALYHLLLEFRKDMEGYTPDYFHKAFRQINVTKSGNVDMAFYALLDDAPIFWAIIEEMYPEKEGAA